MPGKKGVPGRVQGPKLASRLRAFWSAPSVADRRDPHGIGLRGGGGGPSQSLARGKGWCLLVPNASRQEAEANYRGAECCAALNASLKASGSPSGCLTLCHLPAQAVQHAVLSTMFGVRLKAPLSSRASSSCASRSSAGAPRSQPQTPLRPLPAGAAASAQSSRLGPVAAGLLSGLSVGKLRRHNTFRRSTQAAESLERLNQPPAQSGRAFCSNSKGLSPECWRCLCAELRAVTHDP